MPGQRADARRNHALLLAVASDEVAAHGADASLEQIARVAGVGSGTVRRHFPTRRALLEAVFRARVEGLAAQARELSSAPDARAALLEWLSALTEYAATTRGMASVLGTHGLPAAVAAHDNACAARLADAAGPLVVRAIEDGAVLPGVAVTDLITLVTGIALATEHHPDPAAEAHRLLGLVTTGLSPTSDRPA